MMGTGGYHAAPRRHASSLAGPHPCLPPKGEGEEARGERVHLSRLYSLPQWGKEQRQAGERIAGAQSIVRLSSPFFSTRSTIRCSRLFDRMQWSFWKRSVTQITALAHFLSRSRQAWEETLSHAYPLNSVAFTKWSKARTPARPRSVFPNRPTHHSSK